MKKTWFIFFIGLFVLLFTGLWIAGGVAEARSRDMRRRGHHRHHRPVASYKVGGIVNELAGGEKIVLLNNGRDDLEITANGVFTFSKPISDLTTYDVTVVTQPSNQYCRVNNGSGTINGADVTDITIRCGIFSVAIAAGNNHAVLLKNDGTVWTWGDNNFMPFQVNGLTGVIDIAAGDGHTVALKSDGTVWAWGDNEYGQLGNGTRTLSYTPVQVCDTGETAPCANFLTDVIDITAGGDNIWGMAHTVALKSDGTVWAWGNNFYGQLGDGTTTRSATPVQVSRLTGVDAIAAGDDYTIALKNYGTVWAWGRNWPGTLGDGTTDDSAMPVEVSGLTDIDAIATGDNHTLALKADGTVWAWGGNLQGQLGDGTRTYKLTPIQVSGLMDITAIAGGYSHNLALKTDGTVWSWGDNEYGQLGDGTTASSGATPTQVSGLTDVIAIAAEGSLLLDNTAFSRGYSLALTNDGTVWAWGDDEYGQLGAEANEVCGRYSSSNCSLTPVQVLGETAPYIVDNYSLGGTANGLIDGETIVLQNNGADDLAITANGVFSFSTQVSDLAAYNVEILTQPDSQFCRVDNDSGTINGEDVTDLSVTCFDFFTDVIAIAHTRALKSDGTVWAWGDNGSGQLGDGTRISSSTPVQVISLTDVTAIAGGYSHTLALKTDGTVWVWGDNEYGQLGVETVETCYSDSCSSTPVQVSGLTDVEVIAAGSDHTIVLKSDGTVWTWGYNEYGQLGVTVSETCSDYYGYNHSCSTTPVQVSGITDVIAVAGGGDHTIALKSDGTVWAWGSDVAGQLGAETTEVCGFYSYNCSTTPVQVSDLTDVIAITGRGSSTLALKSDGTVWAWGRNYDGYLGVVPTDICGLGSSYNCTITPVQVSGLTDVEVIAAGSDHTIALKSDGTVWAWGWNNSGQLGDGTRTSSTTPLQVSGLMEVVAIAESSALKSDGTVWEWGRASIVSTTSCPDIDMGVSYYPCSITPVPVVMAMDGVYSVGGTVSGLADGETIVLQNNGGDDLTITLNGDFTFDTSVLNAKTYDVTVLIQPYDQMCFISSSSGRISADVTNVSVECFDFFTDVTAIATAPYHSIAIKSDGTVWGWGDNRNGELGDGTQTSSSTPVQVSDLTNVEAVAAGGYWSLGGGYTIALKVDGTVWAWGNNRRGQLGVETMETCNSYSCSTTPVQVSSLTDIAAIAAGDEYAIALKADGTVWAWGRNRLGQLGNETTISSITPVQVSGLTDVEAVASGPKHAIALKSDGTVWAWGLNSSGQLGVGVEKSERCDFARTYRYCSTTPVQVSELTDVDVIAAGGSHNIVLKTDGTMWAWGSNRFGQLGDGTATNSITPVQVSGDLIDIAAIVGEGISTIAIKADGTVWGWGDNRYGQLAVDTTETCTRSGIAYPCRTTPVLINKLTDVAAIAGGIALKFDGTVWKWRSIPPTTPVQVLVEP